MRIFLSGPMGTGKSTVASAVAATTGLACLDLDALIERAEGSTINALFAQRGERAFRDLEASHLQRLLNEHDSCVMALGGGTVTREATRRLLLGSGVLVTLRAPIDELARRLADAKDRPLLAGRDVAATLRQILDERRAAYAECHVTLDATQEPARVAEQVVHAAKEPPIVVALGERTYPVVIGTGVRSGLATLMQERVLGASTAVLVTDQTVGPLHAKGVEQALAAQCKRLVRVELEPGEAAKHIGSVQRIWQTALEAHVDRDAVVVGLGGGVIGDMAGFAAATILRGIRLVHVPTTLLAMVDSAIGGKTGFDTEHGKNLIGAFHQPSFVLSDIELLETLPIEERRAGLAEVVKSAWLDGEEAVASLERDAQLLSRGDVQATLRAVSLAARLKARVVSGDEREGGERALLNLGHTVGHAIEASLGYTGMRHGEAVALGMVAAFRLAHTMGHPAAHIDRMVSLLRTLGLPTDVDRYLSDKTLAFVASDKKRGAGKLKFIVPAAPGHTSIVPLALDDIARRVMRA